MLKRFVDYYKQVFLRRFEVALWQQYENENAYTLLWSSVGSRLSPQKEYVSHMKDCRDLQT